MCDNCNSEIKFVRVVGNGINGDGEKDPVLFIRVDDIKTIEVTDFGDGNIKYTAWFENPHENTIHEYAIEMKEYSFPDGIHSISDPKGYADKIFSKAGRFDK